MAYSLLAHLFPRIKGSQEDIATFSLSYIIEQSSVLNSAFTKLAGKMLNLELPALLSYHCQDADSEHGRPDIAAYDHGKLVMLCEAKFYAGLTENQPVAYLDRLSEVSGGGLLFICPQNRIVPLWDKITALARETGWPEVIINGYCRSYQGIHMAIISWSELISELVKISSQQDPDRLGDLLQLEGFCEKIESEAFIPFKPDDFSVNTARSIDRYYQVIDETHKVLNTYKEYNPSTKGLRASPRWQGYSQYIRMNDFGVSISFIRKLWKSPTSIETPFWCQIEEVVDNKWVTTERIRQLCASLDERLQEAFYNGTHLALIPKPYLDLDEIAEDLAKQIIELIRKLG